MEQGIIYLVCNIAYGLIFFFMVKLRTTKSKDWRMLDSDYEYLETLNKDEQELYWNCMTKVNIRFMMVLWVLMNVALLTVVFSKQVWLILTFSGIGVCFALAYYVYSSLHIKKSMKPMN